MNCRVEIRTTWSSGEVSATPFDSLDQAWRFYDERRKEMHGAKRMALVDVALGMSTTIKEHEA